MIVKRGPQFNYLTTLAPKMIFRNEPNNKLTFCGTQRCINQPDLLAYLSRRYQSRSLFVQTTAKSKTRIKLRISYFSVLYSNFALIAIILCYFIICRPNLLKKWFVKCRIVDQYSEVFSIKRTSIAPLCSGEMVLGSIC